MRPDTREYCDQQMALVRDAVLNQRGYLLKEELQQIIHEFRRDNPRFPAWVVRDDDGYFFPLTYDSNHQYTFSSKNHAIEDVSDYFCDSDFTVSGTKIATGQYRYTWTDPVSGTVHYSCVVLHPNTDEEKPEFIIDIIRHIVEFKNACLEMTGAQFDPFLENPPDCTQKRKKRKPYIER